jgi:GTP:adenosylcobinamide-phosphate guanylyltransferase
MKRRRLLPQQNNSAPMESTGWTAIVLAGQRPGPDLLADHFGEELKALVPLAGEPMLTHVLRALHASPKIGTIIVLAQEPARLAHAIATGGGAEVAASGTGISASIAAIAGSKNAPFPLLITTADHPLLTPAMVAQLCSAEDGTDLRIGMVERQALLAQFPNSKRTWLKFSDGHWSGANLFALTTDKTQAALALWAKAEGDRKVIWRLFLHFGPWLALRALTRTIGLADALEQAGRRLGLSACLIAMTNPVAAIDVDKPADHDLATAIFKARS